MLMVLLLPYSVAPKFSYYAFYLAFSFPAPMVIRGRRSQKGPSDHPWSGVLLEINGLLYNAKHPNCLSHVTTGLFKYAVQQISGSIDHSWNNFNPQQRI